MTDRNKRRWTRFFVWLTAFLGATVSSATLGRLLKSQDPPTINAPLLGAGRINDSLEQVEIRVVYIGRSSCGWCTSPELKLALKALRPLLRARNDSLGVRGSFQGVAVDLDPALGIEHLNHLAPFDEIGSGRGWSSAVAQPYVTGKFAGPLATPQVLVIERLLRFPDSAGTGLPLPGDERLLTRKVGLMEIAVWVREGARVLSTDGFYHPSVAANDTISPSRSR
jgi:hypothetical protein